MILLKPFCKISSLFPSTKGGEDASEGARFLALFDRENQGVVFISFSRIGGKIFLKRAYQLSAQQFKKWLFYLCQLQSLRLLIGTGILADPDIDLITRVKHHYVVLPYVGLLKVVDLDRSHAAGGRLLAVEQPRLKDGLVEVHGAFGIVALTSDGRPEIIRFRTLFDGFDLAIRRDDGHDAVGERDLVLVGSLAFPDERLGRSLQDEHVLGIEAARDLGNLRRTNVVGASSTDSEHSSAIGIIGVIVMDVPEAGRLAAGEDHHLAVEHLDEVARLATLHDTNLHGFAA